MAYALLSKILAALGTSTSAQNTLLTQYLNDASADAERLIGVPAGGMARQVGIIENVQWDQRTPEFILTQVYPIESISNVVQFYCTTSDEEFAAEVAADDDADPSFASLFQNVDWVLVANGRLGQLQRINDERWFCQPRCLQLVYTAGWIDPSTESPPDTAIQPPADIQEGIVWDVIRRFQAQRAAGLAGTIQVGGGASLSLLRDTVHPNLVEACERWRRSV